MYLHSVGELWRISKYSFWKTNIDLTCLIAHEIWIKHFLWLCVNVNRLHSDPMTFKCVAIALILEETCDCRSTKEAFCKNLVECGSLIYQIDLCNNNETKDCMYMYAVCYIRNWWYEYNIKTHKNETFLWSCFLWHWLICCLIHSYTIEYHFLGALIFFVKYDRCVVQWY